MEILAGVNPLNKLLQEKYDTMWEALGEVLTCRQSINRFRTSQGFLTVWNFSLEFTKKHRIVTTV